MTEYNAHFHTERGYALYHFDADSSEQALRLARELCESEYCPLEFDDFEGDFPLEEIVISSDTEDRLAVWQDDDLRLRLAAHQLLEALEAARVALNTAPLFRVPSLDSNSYKIAALCDAAIAAAKPLTPTTA